MEEAAVRRELSRLFMAGFSTTPDELRRLLDRLRDGAKMVVLLPGEQVSPATFIDGAAEVVCRHGAVDANLFAHLQMARPELGVEVRRLASQVDVPRDAIDRASRGLPEIYAQERRAARVLRWRSLGMTGIGFAVGSFSFWIGADALAIVTIALVVFLLLRPAHARRPRFGYGWFAVGTTVGLVAPRVGPALLVASSGGSQESARVAPVATPSRRSADESPPVAEPAAGLGDVRPVVAPVKPAQPASVIPPGTVALRVVSDRAVVVELSDLSLGSVKTVTIDDCPTNDQDLYICTVYVAPGWQRGVVVESKYERRVEVQSRSGGASPTLAFMFEALREYGPRKPEFCLEIYVNDVRGRPVLLANTDKFAMDGVTRKELLRYQRRIVQYDEVIGSSYYYRPKNADPTTAIPGGYVLSFLEVPGLVAPPVRLVQHDGTGTGRYQVFKAPSGEILVERASPCDGYIEAYYEPIER